LITEREAGKENNDKKQGFRIGRHSFFDMKEQEA